MNIPKSMYSKGPKNNPSPGKSWSTTGKHSYGDANIRILSDRLPQGPEPDVYQHELVSLTKLKGS